MPTAPIQNRLAPASGETVEQRFRRLEAIWTAETSHLSSTSKLLNHDAFQEIISMGPAVVPFLLRDLKERPRLWVWALPAIVGYDPVPAADRGDIERMTAAWLQWAKANGHQC
jgi:hypothetical protein